MSLSIGQSPGYINSLENRNGFPSMQVFFYICEYLGVTPAEFFDDGSDHPVEYKEVLDEIKLLSHENAIILLSIRNGEIAIRFLSCEIAAPTLANIIASLEYGRTLSFSTVDCET